MNQETKFTPLKPETLANYRESWTIQSTGRDSKGNEYNSIGKLNQAAWLGEKAVFMLDEIDRLKGVNSALFEALQLAEKLILSYARDCKPESVNFAIKPIRAAIAIAQGKEMP